MRRALAAGLLALALLALGTASRAEVDRNTYRGRKPAVEITFPADWIVAEQASFPGLLATATDAKVAAGGRMTLTLEELEDGETVRQCAERNRLLLGKLRFATQPLGQHATGAVVLQAVNPSGKKIVRQAYRKFDGDDTLVFVVTLAAPRELMPRYTRAFDDTVRSLTRERDPAAAEGPVDRDETEGVDPSTTPAPSPAP